MTLPNPIDININAVDKDLVRINTDQYGSHYRLQSTTERIDLKIRHSTQKPDAAGTVRDNHNVELTWTIFSVVAGTPDTVNKAYVTFVHGQRDVGVNPVYLVTALADLLKEAGVIADLVAWQN